MTTEHLIPPDPAALLRQLFHAAVQAVLPVSCVPQHLPSAPTGKTLIVGAGKAAAAMAQAVEEHWSGPLSGMVVTRYGHGLPCRRIEVIEAAHPVPDQLGMQSAARMLDAVNQLERTDLVLALISGGGSSLLSLPAPGITLADKQALSRALLRSGAPIEDINIVRSHLSRIKGGRLATAAAPAHVVSLIISDIPDNNPAWVASGPTVANDTTRADALAIVERYGIPLPAAVRTQLERPSLDADVAQTSNNVVSVIATASDALQAAKRAAEDADIQVRMLGDELAGEARQLGREHGLLARGLKSQGLDKPILLLSGGETSVTMTGHGRGGRNSEYLLSLALALDGAAGIHALAADTDGIDGSQDNAGALVRPDTLRRAHDAGVDAAACLAEHDSYGFFAALDDLLVTGPTRTNVNDFRAILVEPNRSAHTG